MMGKFKEEEFFSEPSPSDNSYDGFREFTEVASQPPAQPDPSDVVERLTQHLPGGFSLEMHTAMKDALALIQSLQCDRDSEEAWAEEYFREWQMAETEIERLFGEYKRVQEDRAALLDITSTDGLSSSEWLMRTALAEKRLTAATKEIERLKGSEGEEA